MMQKVNKESRARASASRSRRQAAWLGTAGTIDGTRPTVRCWSPGTDPHSGITA